MNKWKVDLEVNKNKQKKNGIPMVFWLVKNGDLNIILLFEIYVDSDHSPFCCNDFPYTPCACESGSYIDSVKLSTFHVLSFKEW